MTNEDAALVKRRILMIADHPERSLTKDYSGRGMYGKTCWGITCDDPNDVIATVGAPGAKTDSMGRSTIVYWPAISGD